MRGTRRCRPLVIHFQNMVEYGTDGRQTDALRFLLEAATVITNKEHMLLHAHDVIYSGCPFKAEIDMVSYP